jgi:oligopeptide transport system permease protein
MVEADAPTPPKALTRLATFGRPRLNAGWLGPALLILIALPCFVTLPWSLQRYATQDLGVSLADQPPRAPSWSEPLGSDSLGRSMLWRCLLGGAISLTIGIAAALLSVILGVIWGAMAGYLGGRVDSTMMRIVDVLYGLPYILLVVLVDLALQPTLLAVGQVVWPANSASQGADVATLLLAIGAVSWLTMARVIRGQVLSLREQPFVEAARAVGAGPMRILGRHLLPNLIGPIVVYTTLTVPAAILQESFLSFLGIGVQAPLPSWGNLATAGVQQLPALARGSFDIDWWLLVFPCLLLGLTLMALNFVGDSMRHRFDPKSQTRG